VKSISLILLAAGNSTRFGLPVKKQWLYQYDKPLWLFVLEQLQNSYSFKDVIVVANPQEIALMRSFSSVTFVPGGSSRQESLSNALKHTKSDFVVVNDVARSCVPKELLLKLIEYAKPSHSVVPALKLSDTCYFDGAPIDREKLLRIQTPQLSCTATLKELLKTAKEFTDESTLFFNAGKSVTFIEGSTDAHKLTYQEDLALLRCLQAPINQPKNGFGLDIHSFEENKPMVLAGVSIDSPFGFKAHSDGDVAIHALIDALLGASGLGDIGELFPDNDPTFKNADSKELLQKVTQLVRSVGYEIIHCDLTILAQVPKITPYKEQMRTALATIMSINRSSVNIKATTAEKMGFVGRKEGVTVYATATLNYYRWDKI
jgi:2-C-methyl-D-erythritol 4-phosphate cytidylyltransferase/2-C-methyl-D-erythritol 2,4-cyclodiphosphate synthase